MRKKTTCIVDVQTSSTVALVAGDMNMRQTRTQQCENRSWSCWTAVVHSSLTAFSCRLGTLARDDCSFQMVADDGWIRESSDIEAPGAWVKKWKLTGLGAVGRCEPGECTSHRNRRSVRKFLSRPTNGGQRGVRGKSGQRALKNGRFINVSGDSSVLNQTELQRGNSADISPQSCADSPRTSLIHLAQSLPSLTPWSRLTSDLWTLTET